MDICAFMHAKSLKSCLTLCNPRTAACQAPLSMGLSRQEYWSELSHTHPRDLPNPRIELVSPVSCTTGEFLATEPAGKPCGHL